MILNHHHYRLSDGNKVFASADKLADARVLANRAFTIHPEMDQVVISAWCFDKKNQRGGFTNVCSLQP